MTLSAGERAILELLLVRDFDYDAIGGVLGAEAAEARTRAHAALATLAGSDLGPAVADYLLGRADAGEQESAKLRLVADAETNSLARRTAEALEAEFGADAVRAPIPTPAGPAGRTPVGTADVPRRTGVILAAALAALAVVAVVLAVTGAFSDDEADAPPTESAATTDSPTVAEPIRIELEPVGGGDARGSALIGLTDDGEPFLELDLQRLEPAPKGTLHLLWVDVEKGKGLPLPPAIPVGSDGAFRERFELPLELARIVDLGRSLEIVRSTAADLREITREISNPGARTGPDQLPDRPGRAILSGRIPRA